MLKITKCQFWLVQVVYIFPSKQFPQYFCSFRNIKFENFMDETIVYLHIAALNTKPENLNF